MKNTTLWTKDFISGTFINFFLMLNYYTLIVVMTVYAMDQFASSPSEAGFAASIFIIGALASRLLAGRWLEYVGRRRMLMGGILANLILTALYLVVHNIWLLLIIRFLHGASYGAASTAVATFVTSIIPKERQGEGVGYYMLSWTLGSAIGPFLGMFTIQHGSFAAVFTVCIIVTLLSLINAFFIKVPEIQRTQEQAPSAPSFKLSGFFEPKAIPISFVCAVMYFAYSSIISFLTPYAQELHLMGAASFFFIVFSFVIMLSRPFTGRLFDSKGHNITMFPAFAAFMAGMALLSTARYGAVLLAAAVLLGYGVGVIQSCGLAMAVKSTPLERLALANSTFYIFIDAGFGIGPVILGTFIPYTGYSHMYMGMVVVALIATLSFRLVGQRTARKPVAVTR